MKTAGICFLVLGGVLLLVSGANFGFYWIFEKMPHKTAKTLGRLCGRKYKKDVAVWAGLGKYDGPPRIAFTIKHLTKTKYVYNVNNKLYFCCCEFFKKPRAVPDSVAVIYIKAFPCAAYLDNDENCIGAFDFFVKGIVVLGMSICAFALAAAFLGKV